MKKILLLTVPLLLMVVLPFSNAFVYAANDALDATYFENFEYGDTDIDALPDCGTTEIRSENGNHFLHFQGNDVDYILSCFGPYVADFDFSVRIRQNPHNGDWSWAKIMYHSEWGEHNTFRFDLYNYRVQANYLNTDKKIEKVFGENTKIKFESGVWRDVKICARGTKYTIYVDGEKAVQFISDYNDEGCFGFAAWQSDFDVDDIVIYEYPDGAAPEIIDETAAKDNEIIENVRENRTMNDAYIETSSLETEASVKGPVAIIAFGVAGASFIGLVAICIAALIKKKKQKGSE